MDLKIIKIHHYLLEYKYINKIRINHFNLKEINHNHFNKQIIKKCLQIYKLMMY